MCGSVSRLAAGRRPTARRFLPFHGELRGTYWFGKGVFAKKGLRPYVHLGGGLAQVDGRVKVTIADCEPIVDDNTYNNCIKGDPGVKDQTTGVPMDVWKKMGQGFITAGGGMVYAFTRQARRTAEPESDGHAAELRLRDSAVNRHGLRPLKQL